MLRQDSKNEDTNDVINYLKGDENSLKILIERYFKQIYNFVHKLCGNNSESEDITQEVFLKIWKNLKQYDPNQSFKAWIFKIARNTTIDWLRKKKEFVFSDFENEEGDNYIIDTITDNEALPEEKMMRLEEKKSIDILLDKLPHIYKEVLVLRYTESLTFEEIGVVLDKPLETVKSQHRRAIMKLKKIIETED
ncbi:MAG: RNA polymerase sigma factor [bacterium]